MFGLTLFPLLALVGLSASTVPKEYSSYRPIPLCKPASYFRYPTTIADVQAIVKEAIATNQTVKAFGVRHSQTDIICTEGIPVETLGLKFFQLNSDLTATFGAGVNLNSATTFLRQNGRALKTTPSFGNITIGGAIGTGAHGSTIKYKASISSQVVGVTIVNGLGEIQEITDKDDLKAFRLNLGLLGFVVRVTLATHELYKVHALNTVHPDSYLTDGTVTQWAKNADQMSIYWFPSMGQIVKSKWTMVDVNTPGDAFTYDHVPSSYDTSNMILKTLLEAGTILSESGCEAVRDVGFNALNVIQYLAQNTLVTQVPGFVPIYTEDGVTVQNPAVGYYDLMFAPTCRDDVNPSGIQCIWAHGNVDANITILDNEISFALSDLPEAIAEIKSILKLAPAVFPVQGILMRFSAASKQYMSNAYGRDSVHFEWYVPDRRDIYRTAPAGQAAYQTVMQLLTKKYSGRSHWGKSGMVYQSKEMLDLKLDPVARQGFVAAMNKFDPTGVFLNKFGRRLKGISALQDLNPLNTHCALRDFCFCKQDSDCGKTQTCTNLQGYSYNVCQTKGERPVPLITPNFQMSDVRTVLTSLKNKVVGLVDLLADTVGCLLPGILLKTGSLLSV